MLLLKPIDAFSVLHTRSSYAAFSDHQSINLPSEQVGSAWVHLLYIGRKRTTYLRARALLFVHMRVRPHARALSISMPLPSTCSSLRLIHAELPRLSSALGGQTRRADGAAAAADTAGLDSSQSSSLGEAVWDSFSAR